MRILSIEAWANPEGGWNWNNWWHVGDIKELPKTTRGILRLLRAEGYLTDASKGRVAVEDDGYNIVILDRNTREPLLAIEYGELS